MKLKCVNNNDIGEITLGKTYEGEIEYSRGCGGYVVENDFGRKEWYYGYRFESVVEEEKYRIITNVPITDLKVGDLMRKNVWKDYEDRFYRFIKIMDEHTICVPGVHGEYYIYFPNQWEVKRMITEDIEEKRIPKVGDRVKRTLRWNGYYDVTDVNRDQNKFWINVYGEDVEYYGYDDLIFEDEQIKQKTPLDRAKALYEETVKNYGPDSIVVENYREFMEVVFGIRPIIETKEVHTVTGYKEI